MLLSYSHDGNDDTHHGADTFVSLVLTMMAGLRSLRAFGMRPITKRYHPERHYMRGPGPAWRAKHLPKR